MTMHSLLRGPGSLLIAAVLSLLPAGEAAAQQDITGLWKDASWEGCVGITQEQGGTVKMRVRPEAAFDAEGKLTEASLVMTHALTANDVKNEKMLKYDDEKDRAETDVNVLKGKPVFPADKPGTVSADGETITLTYTKWSARKAKGEKEPAVSSEEVTLTLKRCLSVKVHVPRARDPDAPLAPDKTGRGVITLTNDGIDLERGPFPAARMDEPKGPPDAPPRTLEQAFDLQDLDTRVLVDSQRKGAGARNLVQIDLTKDAVLKDGTVILNVYQMVSVDGTYAKLYTTGTALKCDPATDVPKPPPAGQLAEAVSKARTAATTAGTTATKARAAARAAPGDQAKAAAATAAEARANAKDAGVAGAEARLAAGRELLPPEPGTAVRLWREETQATRLGLPYAMKGDADTLYIEGLKAGRYRLVLLYVNGGATVAANLKTAADLKANEEQPNDSPASGRMKLLAGTKDYDFPPDNARLPVARVDIYQENARSRLFDVLWNGHAVIQGRMWPAGGIYLFSQQTALPLPAHWMNIGRNNAFVALPPTSTQPAPPADKQDVAFVKGGFVVERGGIAAGGPVTGSGLYDARLLLIYAVEGVHLIRRAPLTILVPSAVRVADWGGMQRNDQGHYTAEGSLTDVNFKLTYFLLDQNGRRMRLLWDDAARLTYGATLRMWEALNGVARGNEQLTVRRVENGMSEIYWKYTDRDRTEYYVMTVPRARAVPFKKPDPKDEQDNFHDTLGVTLSKYDPTKLKDDTSMRKFYDEEMIGQRLHGGDTILDVIQDIVCVVDNGDASDNQGLPGVPVVQGKRLTGANVRVGGTNHLRVIAPVPLPGGRRGPISLQMAPGILDANQPTLVLPDYFPGQP